MLILAINNRLNILRGVNHSVSEIKKNIALKSYYKKSLGEKEMKKKTIILILCLIFSCNVKNVMAATAYSVGCKYPASTGFNEDTTQIAKDAAYGYGLASEITGSYYNTEPTFSYLNSTTRLGKSRAFFIAGHASPQYIVLASSAGKTGVGVSEGYAFNYHLVGLANKDMSQTRVITFAGCNTANLDNANIAKKAFEQGAKASIGWITTTDNNQGWLKTFNYSLGYGYSVNDSITRANASNGGTNTSIYVYVYGDRQTKITTYNKSLTPLHSTIDAKLLSDQTYQEISKPLTDTYMALDMPELFISSETGDIFYEPLRNYSDSFKNVINSLESIDSDFDVNDYYITYRIIDESTMSGFLQLTYHIDEQIKTNKGYLFTFENKKIVEKILSGVKRKNLKKIDGLDTKQLLEKVYDFNQKKMFELEKNIPSFFGKSAIPSKSSEFSVKNEYFFYDYNNEKLEYDVEIVSEDEDEATSMTIKKIEV